MFRLFQLNTNTEIKSTNQQNILNLDESLLWWHAYLITKIWYTKYRDKRNSLLDEILIFFKGGKLPTDIKSLIRKKDINRDYLIPAMVCYISEVFFGSDFEFMNLFTNKWNVTCYKISRILEPKEHKDIENGILEIKFDCRQLLNWGNRLSCREDIFVKLDVLSLLLKVISQISDKPVTLKIYMDFIRAEDNLTPTIKNSFKTFASEIQKLSFKNIEFIPHHIEEALHRPFIIEMAKLMSVKTVTVQHRSSLPNSVYNITTAEKENKDHEYKMIGLSYN